MANGISFKPRPSVQGPLVLRNLYPYVSLGPPANGIAQGRCEEKGGSEEPIPRSAELDVVRFGVLRWAADILGFRVLGYR